VAVGLVGVSFASIFIRWSDSPPLVIAAYRMVIVSLLLLPLALHESRGEILDMDRRDLWILALIGAILAVHFFTFISSVKMTSVASAILLASCHPVLVGIVSLLVLREGSRSIGLGIVAGMSGLVMITAGDLGGGHLQGDIVALVSGLFFAAYLLLGRVLRQRTSLITYVFVVFSFCAAVLLAAALLTGQAMWPLPVRELLIFLALAVISTIFGHLLFNFSLRYMSAPVISIAYLGEPIGAIILAAALLDEIPSLFALLGGAMVLAGIVLTVGIGRTGSRNRGTRPGP